MSNLWESIPAPIRTIINVVVGAAFASAISYVLGNFSGGSIDLNALGKVVLVAAGTALVRALNPADSAYGLGALQYTSAPSNTGVPNA